VQAGWAEGAQDRRFRCLDDGRERLRYAREIPFALDEAIVVKPCAVHDRTVPRTWLQANGLRPSSLLAALRLMAT
jgi:hypothetical protein